MANATGRRPVRKTSRQESDGLSATKDTWLRKRLLTTEARNNPVAHPPIHHNQKGREGKKRKKGSTKGSRCVQDSSSPEPHVRWHRFGLEHDEVEDDHDNFRVSRIYSVK